MERLHALLDSRNAAAVFNATAMAAGGGRGIDNTMNPNFLLASDDISLHGTVEGWANGRMRNGSVATDMSNGMGDLRINTNVPSGQADNDELSATNSVSGSEWSNSVGDSERGAGREIWTGELSSVIGLQKRGLRGLMEGRRMRANVDREREGSRVQDRNHSQKVGLGIGGS